MFVTNKWVSEKGLPKWTNVGPVLLNIADPLRTKIDTLPLVHLTKPVKVTDNDECTALRNLLRPQQLLR
jgi:hypothetical protein